MAIIGIETSDFTIYRLYQGEQILQSLRLGSEVKVERVDPTAGDYRGNNGIIRKITDKAIEVGFGDDPVKVLWFSHPLNLKSIENLEGTTPIPLTISNVAHSIFLLHEQVKVNAPDRVHFNGKAGRVERRADEEHNLYLVNFGNEGKRDFLSSELKPITIGHRTLTNEVPSLPSDLSIPSGRAQLVTELLDCMHNKPVFYTLLDLVENRIENKDIADGLATEIGNRPRGVELLREIVDFFRVHGNPMSPNSLSSYCRSSVSCTEGKKWLFNAAAIGYIRISLEGFKLSSKSGDDLVAVLGIVLNGFENSNKTLAVWEATLLPSSTIRDLLRELTQDVVTKEIMEIPVRIVGCGHVLDETTAFKLMEEINPRCPCCRGDLTEFSRDGELKAHIDALKQMAGDNLDTIVDG